MDAYKRTQLSPKDFQDTLGVKPALSIPFEPVLFGEAANAGQIAAQSSPLHKTIKLIEGLAQSLSGKSARVSERKLGMGMLSWLRA
jgi:pilus assembly protein CpaE